MPRIPDSESQPLSEREVSRAWDGNADSWAEQVRKGWDVYREFYNNPAFLEFIGESIGDLAGLSILDAGCGEGYNTRILARRGAKMTGADLAPRMIELAREEEHREPLGIRYEVNSFSDLSAFAGVSFDAAVSFMALMDGPDFPGAMRAIHRVLRPGGMLVFSIIHPCFITKGLTWIRDEAGHETALTVAHYFDDTPWVERWKFSQVPTPESVEPHPMGEFRRVPMRRLIAKLGLGEFVNEGPLTEHRFAPRKVTLPLKQHAGAPAVAVVKSGDRVRVGDLIAAPEAGKLGARIHASIDGRATVGLDAIVIDA